MRYLAGVSSLTYDPERCVGCGLCTEVCPHGVFVVVDGKARITDRDRCMECGACMTNCMGGAIDVNAGVGCAAAIIRGLVTGEEPSCGCSDDSGGCC